MDEINKSSAVEAILFASGDSVELSRIAEALQIGEEEAEALAEELADEYEARGSGIMIIRLNTAFQMVSRKEYAPQIRTVMDLRRNTPLSQAALEVLAVVAYNQPVTKAFVEQVRGVDCSGVIGSLTAKGLIEEKCRLELPGRPLLYGTTEHFLRCFNVSSLEELPPLPEDGENKDDNSSEENKAQDNSILENTDEQYFDKENTTDDNSNIE